MQGSAGGTGPPLLAVAAAATAGVLGMGVMPLLFGGLVDSLGIAPAAAGALVTGELTATTVVSLGAASALTHQSRRSWALAGAGVAVLGHGASAFAGSYALLLTARVLAGAGAGACLAAANAAAAADADPDRLFAKIALAEGLATGLVLVGLPGVIVPFGVKGAFLALCGLTLLLTPWMASLPPPLTTAGAPTEAAANRGPALVALTALLLLSVAGMAIWSLSERIGLRVGLAPDGVGLVLGVATVAGLAGAAAAAWLGTRFGRQRPLQLSIAFSTVSMVFIAIATEATPFVVWQLVWGVAFFFMIPYVMGVAAVLDRRGQWTAAAAGVSAAGTALGPLAGGLLAGSAGALALAVAAIGAAGAALVYPVVRRVDRGSVPGIGTPFP